MKSHAEPRRYTRSDLFPVFFWGTVFGACLTFAAVRIGMWMGGL